jgi:outer membrane lipoprotein
MHILWILLLELLLLAQGCSYAITSSTAARADRSIPFEKLAAEPGSFDGRLVIVGGVIARTQAVKDGTLIEVLQKDLDYWGKPRRTERSGGRFFVLHRAVLDPMVYAPGREVTVAGEVSVKDRKGLAEVLSTDLLLRVTEMKLWSRERLTSDKPQWIDPLYDPHMPQGTYGY